MLDIHVLEQYVPLIPHSFNLLKMKRNLLYMRHQSVPRCKHFPPWL
jgi:hypothetical protein